MKDLMGLMKQAQELQGRMKEAQEKLDAESVTGESGAGLVRITLSGKGDIRDIALDPSILVASEKEVVEDLIKAAFADARGKIEAVQARVMKEAAGGLPLPPGFSFPG
ncbi:YbaB/EbfC family nucleoid-associated protein [Hyphobacterium indicum]|jgi:nucleoid-associated protein EbfC|uniref:YbaB/EbfC family nucleoid-associated protein n=1 Tax=Hyphobacterium indicum TaxID=2162714 RepID=UPI000D650523|nr:YbaB/EbfC family nucleoid-associated protein [Hyphobacterium indicum]